jgi:microcystin-dependent protein
MIVTNQTSSDLYFGPLHLGAGVGTTLTVDDTSDTSLYLTNDSVADALNNAYNSGHVSVSGAVQPFPRPTGTPALLHGDGDPNGLVFAPQGSVYMRRDGTVANGGGLYIKTTGATISTGWIDLPTASGATAELPPGLMMMFGAAAAPSGWLLCDGSAVSRTVYSLLFAVVGTTYGVGDGSTTFNVPDMRGRVPAGFAASGGHADVSSLGNGDTATVAHRRPKHRHTVSGATQAWGGGGTQQPIGSGTASNLLQAIKVGSDVTNDSLDAPSWLVVNYVIKS